MRDGLVYHFLSPASQFTSTVKGGIVITPLATVSSRKRFPSAVTSYSNSGLREARTNFTSKSTSGTPGSKEGLGPAVAFTATAIIFPSASTKNSSFPSPRQRGCSPPAIEIFVWPSPSGNGRTYTSSCPLASDVYAIQWLSGES